MFRTSDLSCVGAFAFFVASLFTMFAGHELKEKYVKHLSNEQIEYYVLVKKERMHVWILATFAALICAFGVFAFIDTKNAAEKSCVMTFTFFIVQYFVYMLYPKKYWMLNKAQSTPDVENWLGMYKTMSRRYHMGFIFGIIAFFFISFFLNNQ